MSEARRKTLRKYGIAALVAGLMAWAVFAIRTDEVGAFLAQDRLTQFRILCDAFTVPGMLLILSGLLVFVSNEGGLDGLSYLGHYMKNMFIPGKRSSTKKYYDYVEAKREKKKSGFGFLFVVGGVCLVIGFVFLGLFYAVL